MWSLTLFPAFFTVAWVEINPTAEIVEGKEVTLRCVAAQGDQPYALYTWYRNGEWLQEGPFSFLTFPKVLSVNSGSYHCRAQDSLGSSRTSPPATLTVLCEYTPRFWDGEGILWVRESS